MPGTNGVAQTGTPTLRECLHCQKEHRSHSARGLCSACYKNPAVRDLYPVRPPYQRPKGLTPLRRDLVEFVNGLPSGVDPVVAWASHRGIHRNTAQARIDQLRACGVLAPGGGMSDVIRALFDVAELLRTLPVATNDRPRVEAMRRRIAALAGGQP
jgi:hypothetical protein